MAEIGCSCSGVRDDPSASGAIYWRAVTQYKATNDPTVLSEVAEELQSKYPASVWATKAIPWLPPQA